jgi:sugar phosphate isomerase/epimerase
MRIAYAYRRSNLYPYQGGGTSLPEGEARTKFLRRVNEIGFDGLELSLDALGGLDATRGQITELRKELEEHGAPCAVVKGGGGLHHYRVAAENRAKLEKAVEVAAWIGAETVNTGAGGYTDPRLGPDRGGRVSYGSSAQATEEDFVRTATGLREVGEMAGANGLNITIEVHQHSIADNSSSALHILDLADSPYVHANPDLGNILWTYETPDETPEEAILALAPRSKYWHCKNLIRVHIPENRHSIFLRVPLPDGEIDYRFAIHAMIDAGYDGYLAVEGAKTGDALHADRRSLDYVKSVIADLEA